MNETSKSDKKRPKPKMIPRIDMPRQDPKVRTHNFNEVALGYTEEMAVSEAKRCIQCDEPTCIDGCPVEIDIPRFIRQIAEQDFIGSARTLKEKNVLPAICGRVCPQEDQCEIKCILAKSKKFGPVAIGRLERFAADYERNTGQVEKPKIPASTGKKVAVVGSGPAGLTVAGDLIMLGHEVTIFEALHKPGGVLVYGIPEFRLPKAIVAAEVDYIKKLGVKLELNQVIGQIATVDELLSDSFDAVFLGTGAGLPYFLNVPGENLLGIYSANEFLTRSNLMKAYLFPEYDTPIQVGERVAVLGAGNVSMDSARTSKRLGAKEVYDIYRRSRTEMPARKEEVENAEEEGIIFHLLTTPTRFIGDEAGRVRAMELIKMELGEPDSSGRRRPVPIQGSEYTMEVDTVVVAIGQGPNPLVPSTTPGLETSKWGTIVADLETGQTSKPGVFAGGDIVTGGATVILAMGAGRKAARAIHKHIMEK